jgi:hypothetical protein
MPPIAFARRVAAIAPGESLHDHLRGGTSGCRTNPSVSPFVPAVKNSVAGLRWMKRPEAGLVAANEIGAFALRNPSAFPR